MPTNFRPEADVQLIPFYQYDPEIHQIEYRYFPTPSGESYTAFNPTFGAQDYRFYPYPRPFYPPYYGGYPYGGFHPYGGYHGPWGYYHHDSSSR